MMKWPKKGVGKQIKKEGVCRKKSNNKKKHGEEIIERNPE